MKILKWEFKRKDGYQIILAAVLFPLLIIFVPQLQTEFSALPDNAKNFFSTLGAASVGVSLFFIKKFVERKHEKLKDIDLKQKNDNTQLVFTIELFEMFMFMMMPTLASFGLIPELIKQQPYLIVIIFLSAVAVWFGISLYHIYKRYGLHDGKIVKTHIYTFGGEMIIMGVGFTLLIILLQSFRQ